MIKEKVKTKKEKEKRGKKAIIEYLSKKHCFKQKNKTKMVKSKNN